MREGGKNIRQAATTTERRKRTTEKRRLDSTSRSGNATDELDWTTARDRCWWTDEFFFVLLVQ